MAPAFTVTDFFFCFPVSPSLQFIRLGNIHCTNKLNINLLHCLCKRRRAILCVSVFLPIMTVLLKWDKNCSSVEFENVFYNYIWNGYLKTLFMNFIKSYMYGQVTATWTKVGYDMTKTSEHCPNFKASAGVGLI